MSNEADERIKAAAEELSAALTEGGKDYWVQASSIEVTRLQSVGREFAYTVTVTEQSTRQIAP